MAHEDLDISSGSWSRDYLDGVHYLNDVELSRGNREYWDNLYPDRPGGYPTGYDYAMAIWQAVNHQMMEDGQENTSDGQRYMASQSSRLDQGGSSAFRPTPDYGDDDINENGSASVERQSEENIQNYPDMDGLPITPPYSPDDQKNRPDQPLASSALEDPNYGRVVNGWNQKLDASSQEISSLVPFCELYAVFDQGDIITQEDKQSTRYTSIKKRMIAVNFLGANGQPPALPEGLSLNCSIVRVAGDNKSQLESDSAIIEDGNTTNTYKSYKGVPGIGDLSVSRGSAAAQNVKYDLSITMPNPELINERFEYSKLMLLNSPFLIVYGWNIKDGSFVADHYPPVMDEDKINDVVIGSGIGGFWSAAVINLSNFSFSFDSVGHLVGKLTFLNSSGIFLGTLSTEAVGTTMESVLTEPSESVLSRVGGEENQNFIWSNGVPWSATPPDTAEAHSNNDLASKKEILTNYFFIETGRDINDLTLYNKAVEEQLEGHDITPDVAKEIRENIIKLYEMGEAFLENYRIAFLNDLFWRKESGTSSSFELSKIDELQDATTWSRLGDSWSGKQKTAGRGRQYGVGGEEVGNVLTDLNLDSVYEYQVRNAWNRFFVQRFEELEEFIKAKYDASAPFDIGYNAIAIGRVDADHIIQVEAGSEFSEFKDAVMLYPQRARGDNSEMWFKRIMQRERVGRKSLLIPESLQNFITEPIIGLENAAEDVYIKNMPPFGQELQRKTIKDFQDTRNPNFNNFFGKNAKVVPNVLDLIKTTSVISVPTPVDEQDYVSLLVEDRSYSTVFGIPPSDGKKASPDQVLIEFIFLNGIQQARGLGSEEYNADLHEIIFHSSDVLFALKNTVLGDWANDALEVMTPGVDNKISVPAGSINQLEDTILSHVIIPTTSELFTGRFAQYKYAILKNGWIVSQYKETATSSWVDHATTPLVNPTNQEVTGTFFLKSLLPMIASTPDESVNAAIAGASEGQNAEEAYGDFLRTTVATNEASLTSLRSGNADEAFIAAALVNKENAMRNLMNFQSIIDLEKAIISATEGSQMMEQRDMGNAEQDQVVTETDTGQTVHTIMRRPVYFFLGSVLESLKFTTNKKVKFLYSEIVPRRVGEPFFINIPEYSADSVKATYDSQIANLSRQLTELDYPRREEEDKSGNVVMVDVPPVDPNDAAAKELKLKQDQWDIELRDYITARGRDFANLYDYENMQTGRGAGVYAQYRGTAIRQRAPNYGFKDGGGERDGDENSMAWSWYKNYYDGSVDEAGLLNIRAPWVFRIGDKDNYYRGVNEDYSRKGGEYAEGQNPNRVIKTWGPNDTGEPTVNSEGFMRLWRPEDLDFLIGAKENGIDFYWRSPTNITARGGAPRSFAVDSFGKKGTLGAALDYGYQSAFSARGVMKSGAQHQNEFVTKRISNRGVKVLAIMQWLNWYPADAPTMSRYTNLGAGRHIHYGRIGVGGSEWSAPITAGLAKEGRWYLIEWPQGGDDVTYVAPQKFYVKGVVVEDFKALRGLRPTIDNIEPTVGQTTQDVRDRRDQIDALTAEIEILEQQKKLGDLTTQFKKLPIRTTYEIPVNIDTIRQFLTSEPRAPLHKLLKKIVSSTKETIPAIQLSMRPSPSDSTYIDIFPSAMNYDGIIQEVFTEVDIGKNAVEAGDTMGIRAARKSVKNEDLVHSEKVMVCQFGTGKSLVETFGLSSKIDPTAFSSFRLPAVVGGATMNVAEVLRYTKRENEEAYMGILTDFAEILDNGLTTGMDALKKLKIVGSGSDGTPQLQQQRLDEFITSDIPSISKAASSFIEDMMSQDVRFYNKILTIQNEYFTGRQETEEGSIGDPGTRLAGSKFYGNVLSTFLRTANITIHGTTGLNVFNLVYLKGLLNGIEGLYLISSVNESLAASTFTTTLECKLVEYTNNDEQTNPMAYRGVSNLNRLASIIDEVKSKENKEFGADYGWEDIGDFMTETDAAAGILQ
jgi:hypothetical protein